MLEAGRRLRSSRDFAATIKNGVRVGRPTVVVHAQVCPGSVRIGVVVSKAVGGAVRRNLVKRRLRAIAAREFAAATDLAIVLRALPAAGNAPFSTLAQDVHSAFGGAQRKLAPR